MECERSLTSVVSNLEVKDYLRKHRLSQMILKKPGKTEYVISMKDRILLSNGKQDDVYSIWKRCQVIL